MKKVAVAGIKLSMQHLASPQHESVDREAVAHWQEEPLRVHIVNRCIVIDSIHSQLEIVNCQQVVASTI